MSIAILTGFGLVVAAVQCWASSCYYRNHVEPKIRQVQSVAISDLRSDSSERLVFVCGVIEAKSTIGFEGCGNKTTSEPDFLLSESGQKAVVLRRIQMRYFSNDWMDLFRPLFELRTSIGKFHEEFCRFPIYKVPFILVEGGQRPSSDCVIVNMDDSTHFVPLQKAYYQYELIDRFFVFEHRETE